MTAIVATHEIPLDPIEVYLDCPTCGCEALHNESAITLDGVTYRALLCQEH